MSNFASIQGELYWPKYTLSIVIFGNRGSHFRPSVEHISDTFCAKIYILSKLSTQVR